VDNTTALFSRGEKTRAASIGNKSAIWLQWESRDRLAEHQRDWLSVSSVGTFGMFRWLVNAMNRMFIRAHLSLILCWCFFLFNYSCLY